MPVVLNISDGRALPESELEALRNIARSNQSDTLIVGSRCLRLHHISFMDAFSVEPIQGSLLDRLGGRCRRLAESLERQLNHGNTFLQAFSLYMEQVRLTPFWLEGGRNAVQTRINSHAFTVNPGDFPCCEQHLSCPITLCIPKTGVFVKNALHSKVCSLYDKDALSEAIRHNVFHPLSREAFSPEMIVGREECYFDLTDQRFCIISGQDVRF
ncbi:DUF1076 domain-containing protein [Escherichia coli]|nr:DUF1076 domain-containing protein [Escherichia coli]EHW3387211.1 DUF1076 domain-containing protein [Escherichia coli]EIC1511788.1 DUF1076 domain-containing protein [Escherichia coli]EJF7952682.1 DUF1076 domain-containing protein [Escherichia coli]EKD0791646.1 DUF1076 domain-containing protein [Escherichia coli]